MLRAIVLFTRSRIYQQEIFSYLNANRVRSNFWTATANGHLDIAVIEWCKLFGVNDNATHWKKNVDDKKAFRKELLAYLKKSRKEWDAYWASVVDYRNKEVAHFDPGFSPRQVPWLDTAYEAMKFAYEYFQYPKSGLPPNLEDYENKYRPVAKEIIQSAISQTAKIKDDW